MVLDSSKRIDGRKILCKGYSFMQQFLVGAAERKVGGS